MKKLIPLLGLFFLLISTPALAKHNDVSIEAECDAEAEWENHGEYVSCVAHLKQGGQAVSLAAKSDIGKKFDDEEDDEELEPSPTASPSPEVTPSPSPETSPSPGVSPSPEVSPSPSASPEISGLLLSNSDENRLAGLIEKLENLLNKLQNLFD
jgi:hypothetical protein